MATATGDKKKESVFDGFRKRSDLVVPFRQDKIEKAIARAVEAVARNLGHEPNHKTATMISQRVVEQLNTPTSEYYVYEDEDGLRVPHIEDVQDLVEILMAECGETMLVASYKRYRKKREMARRNIRVRGDGRRRTEDLDGEVGLSILMY